MTSLKGKVALVTGAARGIGRAIAVKLAQCGADVVLVDLDIPAESAQLAGPATMALAGDVSMESTWAKLGDAIDERFNRLDIVVNNAAAFPRGLIDELDCDAWRRGFAVNVDCTSTVQSISCHVCARMAMDASLPYHQIRSASLNKH